MMKFLLSIVALVLLMAATPGEVVPVVASDGYFIEQGADATPEVVGGAVADARFAGGALSVVVLASEPPSGATTFADAVLDGMTSTSATVLVVAPETVGWASQNDIWSTSQLNAALDASLDGSTDNAVVEIFVANLVGSTGASSGGGGSGIWIFVAIFVVVVGGIAFLVVRSSKKQSEQSKGRVEELRQTAQLQIDAVANDILDLEDEVKISDNETVKEHYSAAVETYTSAGDRLAAMTSGRDIVELDYELDIAVWHLDAAEAILDGTPVPDKPEPPRYTDLSPSPSSSAPVMPATSSAGPVRRPTRRSSYNAASMAAAAMAAGALGRGRRRSTRSSSRSTRSSSGSSSRTRSRGGGRRR